MPPLPLDVYPLIFGALMVALVASVVEVKAALRAPVCPRCIHCKHVALERRAAAARDERKLAQRLWGIRDEDLDDPDRRP